MIIYVGLDDSHKEVVMAHGYSDGKYRGGKKDRQRGRRDNKKNEQHGSSENHSQKDKGFWGEVKRQILGK